MHLHQELAHRGREPPTAAELEPAQMSAPVRRAEHGVGVLFEFFVGDGVDAGYLDEIRCGGGGKGRGKGLTGSSSALMARNGILMAMTASTDWASR